MSSAIGCALMNDYRRRAALRICDHHGRGIHTAEEACKQIVFFCVEPLEAAAYSELLPERVRASVREWVASLPTTAGGWAAYRGVALRDGDEQSWAVILAECLHLPVPFGSILILPLKDYDSILVRVVAALDECRAAREDGRVCSTPLSITGAARGT
jgi:hypothetical protein